MQGMRSPEQLRELSLNHRWVLSSSSDPRALAIVDGTGRFAEYGPHYSRRTPGSKTFTGVGREIVLVTECGRGVWACVQQRTPQPRGTGGSRGRESSSVVTPTVWRNMIFRNLGIRGILSSELIRAAYEMTLVEWCRRYGSLPEERLRTEIGVREVKSTNPGFCYLQAGWERGPVRRGKLFLYAPSIAVRP